MQKTKAVGRKVCHKPAARHKTKEAEKLLQ